MLTKTFLSSLGFVAIRSTFPSELLPCWIETWKEWISWVSSRSFFFSKLQQSCTEQLSLVGLAWGCICMSAPAAGLQELENKQCYMIIVFYFSPSHPGQVGITWRIYLMYNTKPPNPHRVVNISLLVSLSSTKQPNKHAQDLCMCFNVQPAGSWLQVLWSAELMWCMVGLMLLCDRSFLGYNEGRRVFSWKYCSQIPSGQKSISPWEVNEILLLISLGLEPRLC